MINFIGMLPIVQSSGLERHETSSHSHGNIGFNKSRYFVERPFPVPHCNIDARIREKSNREGCR
ncbi:hypothetical protein RSSM_00453 [Rhodopirellula sallentina SM41]|uniref:Uncharacterized protein n=1 Tax=Rhodopirellula sallentina SM41 TaxID=1263870 RepID=M5UQ23_9BACT|nr:hypothetical protein RSSM_00453 [Rhodopirellula sallentina SM41]